MSLITDKDATGTTTGQTNYSYDDASRLTGITTPGSSKWQFVYDGMDRLRISRSWKWINDQWVQDSEKRRVYLGMDVVQERDGNNNVIASYTRTGNVGGLLARSTASGNVFYGYDGSGNVTSLTDSAGAVVGSYTYDAWGNLLASSGAKANENPYRFSSKEQLAGFYSFGYRFYSPNLGRWINRDPSREEGGNNLYGFVDSDPENSIDDYGLAGRGGKGERGRAGKTTGTPTPYKGYREIGDPKRIWVPTPDGKGKTIARPPGLPDPNASGEQNSSFQGCPFSPGEIIGGIVVGGVIVGGLIFAPEVTIPALVAGGSKLVAS